MTNIDTAAARRPVPMYLHRPDDHKPLDEEGRAWLADQLCSETRVHPDRTMSIGWITSQAAYEYPALLDEIERLRGENDRLREGLDTAWKEAHKMRNASKLVGPYPNDRAATRTWARSLYHAGKNLCELLKPYRTALGEKA